MPTQTSYPPDHRLEAHLIDLAEAGVEEIVHRWSIAVRGDRRIPSTYGLEESTLRDSVPEVLTEVLRLVRLEDPSVQVRADFVFKARDHGRNRARQRFAIDELVREYQVLRDVLYQFLQENMVGDEGVSIDSVLGFCRKFGCALDDALRVTTQTFLEAYTDELRQLSQTDSLTGLFNRRTFFDRLGQEIERARRYDSTFSVALIDLDRFKAVNDRQGHLLGDRLLWRTAEVMEESLRTSDVVCRYGGDEFSVIFPGTSRAAAEELLRRVSVQVLEAARELAAPDDFGLSHGVAEYPVDGSEGRQLVDRADRRLAEAKSVLLAAGVPSRTG